MTESIDKPFARSYWVIPGKLLAGCYPGSQNPEEATEKLRRLLNCGIRCVVNLMEENEVNYGGNDFVPYGETLSRLAQKMTLTVQLVRHPIRDLSVPTRGEMRRILDEIDRAINQGLSVYVHCWGGVGRTGTVVGCYLRRHGVAQAEEILDRLSFLRRDDPTAHRNSPETGAQRSMVRAWLSGQ